jgi:NAD(P)-dependent dehydrogenase (short-subunit alcohol dehydrogenase family)
MNEPTTVPNAMRAAIRAPSRQSTSPPREDRDWYEDSLRRVPQGRFGETWEVVGPAVFLASRASSFVTGTVLLVDGAGRRLRDSLQQLA